jgi:hypothetical protein
MADPTPEPTRVLATVRGGRMDQRNEPRFRCSACKDSGFVLREGVYRDTAFPGLDQAVHTPATYSVRCPKCRT